MFETGSGLRLLLGSGTAGPYHARIRSDRAKESQVLCATQMATFRHGCAHLGSQLILSSWSPINNSSPL